MAKNNDELNWLVAVIGIFSLALVAVDLTYSNLPAMFSKQQWWPGALWVILHALIVIGWFVVINYWQDPNKDKFRVILLILNVAALILTFGHRAGWIENKQVIEDSRPRAMKNKTVIIDSGVYDPNTISYIIMNSEAETIYIHAQK